MTDHGHCVELLERAHGPEQQDDYSSSLDGLDRAGEQVRRERLKVLEDEHSKCLTENLGRVLVVPEMRQITQSKAEGQDRP